MTNVSDHTKCMSLSNQPHMIRSILIDLYPDEHNQGLHVDVVITCDEIIEVAKLVPMKNFSTKTT